jgi:hypothetical protein
MLDTRLLDRHEDWPLLRIGLRLSQFRKNTEVTVKHFTKSQKFFHQSLHNESEYSAIDVQSFSMHSKMRTTIQWIRESLSIVINQAQSLNLVSDYQSGNETRLLSESLWRFENIRRVGKVADSSLSAQYNSPSA